MHVKPSWAAVADKDAVHRSSHGLLICSEAQAAPGPRLYRRPRHPAPGSPDASSSPPFWTLSAGALRSKLECDETGLTTAAAAARLATYGPNADATVRRPSLGQAAARTLVADPADRGRGFGGHRRCNRRRDHRRHPEPLHRS